MTGSDKRKIKVKAIEAQINEGLHPMQDPNVNVRKKAALRVAEKMINNLKEKSK
jgi:hypothetical protein